MIKKVKGGFRLYSHDGRMNLGTYPTMAAAQAREAQVKRFKHIRESGRSRSIRA